MTTTKIGNYRFEHASGRLEGEGSAERLEPKVADLLALLAERAGQIVSRDEISSALWADVVVGDDALPRCVSKLRRALGDDAKAPRYVETVPKRGYRLVAPVAAIDDAAPAPMPTPAAAEPAGGASALTGAAKTAPAQTGTAQTGTAQTGAEEEPHPPPRGATRSSRAWRAALIALPGVVALAWLMASLDFSAHAPDETPPRRAEQLVERADDFYSHITRPGNESAIELYERALAVEPDHARAHAGLANALVQRVLRYPPGESSPEVERIDLGSALASGRLATPQARDHLERALGLAERAVRLDPESAPALKALGFVTSALGRLQEAEAIYERAVALDADAWDVLINLGDIQDIQGRGEEALRHYELAYAAMERTYAEEPQRVGLWLAEMGALIGERHVRAGRPQEAEIWYRRVLAEAPLNPSATCGLAELLRSSGDTAGARRLEEELAERLGDEKACGG